MTIIDVHAHAIFPSIQEEVIRRDPAGFAAAAELDMKRYGPESTAVSGKMVGQRFHKLTSLESRLADMDAAGVDRQVVSPSPNHYYPWAGAEIAQWVAREANRLTAELVAQAPDRLYGLGLAPLQHPALAVEALNEAVLEFGLAGVEISSFVPGAELSHPQYEPVWKRAEELGAVLFLHPFGCSLDERLDVFYLANTVGQPVENAVALSHLIFAGVLDRYPNLQLVAAHGGGYLPTHIGRSDHAWRARADAQGCVHPPSHYLTQLFFDSLVHDPDVLRSLIERVGADRVLLGSDYPFDMGTDDPVGEIRRAGLDPATTEAILGTSAEKLFAPKRARP